MFGALFLILVSTYDFNLGYSLSLSKNHETEINRTLLASRQDFFHFGAGFDLMSWQEWKLGIRPEVLFQHSLVGLQTWIEIEREIEIGPRHDALSIIFGAQQGVHASWILDSPDAEVATPGSRSTYAVGAGLFFGPRVELNRSYSLSLKLGSQLFWGQIAPTSFRSSWGNNWGTLGSISFGIGFKPLPRD